MQRYSIIPIVIVFLLLASCKEDDGLRLDDQGKSVAGKPEETIDITSSTFGVMSLLRNSGWQVEVTGDVSRPFSDDPGKALLVEGGLVIEVYEFSDPADLGEAATKIGADGSTIDGKPVQWKEPPQFFKTDKAIVVLLSNDSDNVKALENTFGPKFAGK